MNFTGIISKLMSMFVTPKANKVPTEDSTLELSVEEIITEDVPSVEVLTEQSILAEEKPIKAKKTTKKVTQKVIK